jgi:hypothetical protein
MSKEPESDAVEKAYQKYIQDTEGIQIPHTDSAREDLKQELVDALSEGENILLDAPTSLGKTRTAARLLSDTEFEGQIVHFSKTKDARDEAREESQEAGLKTETLEGREDACSVAAGDHDSELRAPNGKAPSEWLDYKCEVEGMKFSDAHEELSEYVRSEHYRRLPCSENGMCNSLTQAKNLQQNDIVHLTSNFALSEEFVKDKYVIFDERPGFISTTSKEGMTKYRKSLTTFLERNSDSGYDSNDVFSANEGDKDWKELREIFLDSLDTEKQEETEEGEEAAENTQVNAPKIALAILNGKECGNGRFYGEHGGVEVVYDDGIRIIHETPTLSEAKAVVCMDAHPSKEIWKQELGIELKERKIFEPENRELWRKHERGLFVVQVGDATRSLTTGWRGMEEKATRLVEKLREKFDEDFETALTAKEIKEGVKEMMEESGAKEPELLHYGEQKSTNKLKDEPVGLLVGCIDPGDDYVLDMLALANLKAEPETDEEGDRETGRGFVGEDSESASEFLASVREENLSQSAGRYARDPTDDSISVVYCWSDAIPEGMTDTVVDGVSHKGKEAKGKMVEALRQDGDSMTTNEIFEEIDVSQSTVNLYKQELIDEGVIEVDKGKGPHPDSYRYISGETRLYEIDIGL